MAKNFVQEGAVVTLNAPYARLSGEGALKGSIFGVALGDVGNGVDGEFAVEGVFDLAKTAAQAWTQGQRIYWDDANKRCDSDPTLGILIGAAAAVAANPSATGRVRLNEAVPGLATGAQAAIASFVDNTNGAAADGTLVEVTDLATAGGNTYTDAAVNAKFDLVNNNMKDIAVKMNALLVELRAAGLIAP